MLLPDTEYEEPNLVDETTGPSTVNWTLDDNLLVRPPAFAAVPLINNIPNANNAFFILEICFIAL